MGEMHESILRLRHCLIIESGPIHDGGRTHRFVVMNEPSDHPMVTLIPIVSRKEEHLSDADKLFCPIAKEDGNDHLFRHDSWASFNYAKRFPAREILASVDRGDFILGKLLSETSWHQILDAFLSSGMASKQQKIVLRKVQQRLAREAEPPA